MLSPTDHVHDYVDDYVHDLLSPQDNAALERHCAICAACQAELGEARGRLALLRSIPRDKATEALIQAAIARATGDSAATSGAVGSSLSGRPPEGAVHFNEHAARPAPRASRKWLAPFWITLAASVLIVAGLHVYYANLGPGKYDLAVYGQAELLSGTQGSIRVRLINHQTNQPVAGAPVRIELEGQQRGQHIRLASFTTDAHGSGSPRISLPSWPDGQYQLVVTASKGWSDEVIQRPVSLKRSWRVMLSSDKPVYQPGQTIRLRSLALRKPDLRPVAGEEAVYSIRDPKGNVIFKQRGVTSKYGIASADCPLATELIEGAYQIDCEVGDTKSSRTVEVKKYVLPKFRLSVDLDRTYYAPGDLARATVDAQYFFGQSVAGGQVRLEVSRTDVEPTVIQTLTAELSDDGQGALEFHIPERLAGTPLADGDALLELKATVTDSAGQEQTRTAKTVVTTRPLRIEVLPESNQLLLGIPNRVYLFTTYADGRPAAAHVAVSGVSEEIETNSLGVAVFEVTPTADSTALAMRARDDAGLSVNQSVTLTAGPASQGFIVRTDKAVYDAGETVELAILGGGSEPVFVDLIKDGQTLLTETVDVSGGRGQHQFDLPPELNGAIELCAYRFDAATAFPIRKTQTIFVNEASDVAVQAVLDKPEYRPGEKARLRLTLTDGDGAPQPGAISLAVVDEAVYSVLSDRPGSEQTFFTLNQELLEPVYAIYPWAPAGLGGTNSKDRELLEDALFTRTSRATQTGGDANAMTPFSLSGNSYPEKARAAVATQRTAIKRVQIAWAFLGFVGVLGIAGTLPYITPDRFSLTVAEVVTVLLILCFLLALLVPTAYRAREAARMGSAEDVQFENEILETFGDFTAPTHYWAASHVSSFPSTPTPPRIRQWFPETLLWRPELVTDDQGQVVLDVDLADSITTWRLAASAVTAEGRLGAVETPIRVFQPFFVDVNLPVSLTRADQVDAPVVVYNYLDQPQTVRLTLDKADWFELAGAAEQTIELAPGEVKSTSFRIRAERVGRHELTITAVGSGDQTADAIRREIEVVPNGRLVEAVQSGTLAAPVQMTLAPRAEAVPGSVQTIVRIYPSTFSQVLGGLEGIFHRPYGCFEQTSSTTYPNVLALDYLKRTKQNMPEVEIAARQYIHLGYQRLLTFEVSGGGFEWFGNPPANTTLSAYGLMEFNDMAKVRDVDPAMIGRTRQWLLAQRRSDGSWAKVRDLEDDPIRRAGGDSPELATTAYIAWSVYSATDDDPGAAQTLNYLLAHRPEEIQSAYTLALVSNAIYAIDRGGTLGRPYIDRLASMCQTSGDGKTAWWSQNAGGQTMFYGGGQSGAIETTATATLALLAAERQPQLVRGALAWLIQEKDGAGAWHSTQATVLALKALLAGTGAALGQDQQRWIDILVDDETIQRLVVSPDQADVAQQYVLPEAYSLGEHRLTLQEQGDAATAYQIVFRQYVPSASSSGPAAPGEPLTIALDYDRTNIAVSDEIVATATVRNNMPTSAPMVILDLPIPAGFTVTGDQLDQARAAGRIAKFEITPRSIVVYLRSIEPGDQFKLEYRLRATMPVEVSAPAAAAYLYYDPDQRAEGSGADRIVVTPAP